MKWYDNLGDRAKQLVSATTLLEIDPHTKLDKSDGSYTFNIKGVLLNSNTNIEFVYHAEPNIYRWRSVLGSRRNEYNANYDPNEFKDILLEFENDKEVLVWYKLNY